jgi:hypothetical protein
MMTSVNIQTPSTKITINTKAKWQTTNKCESTHVRHGIQHRLQQTQMHAHNIMGNHPFPTIGTTKKGESP